MKRGVDALESPIMWIRKSEEEIQDYLDQQEAKRRSLLRPFLFALVLTVIAVVLYSLGYRGGSIRSGIVLFSNPSSLGKGSLVSGTFLFVFFFALALYNQRRRSSFFSAHESYLCRECKQPSNINSSMKCECGGKLEPFAYFSWEEDDKPSEVPG